MAADDRIVDYLRRVTADLHRTRQQLHDAEAARHEPVAIVGMACRYPGGVAAPEDLWDLVAAGRDAIGGFPADRGWPEDLYDPDPDTPGRTYCAQGGFLDDVAGFDAEFFGISPREASAMDPQQRLLLEVCWEALERAGLDQHELRGSQTGVYVGGSTAGYVDIDRPPPGTEGYALTGSLACVLSGRISYTLGLVGPAVTLDTACSSSLVALHLAVQALRRGECGLALAGGVTVMASPAAFVEFARQRGLAPDGRCKAFAAGADGTTWAEGVGMLVLERLADARRLGHPVLAVVRGSAVNQDGASSGLTVPNGPSQERVIRAALADAQLTPADIDAVEAHGTGTALGDPIEAQALLDAYGAGRDRPLYLGSLKSNIGHAQAAAGVGGVIKMVQALRNGVLPATLHVDRPTPMADWDGGVSLLTEAVAWPRNGHPRRAGVSSFGVSGTNAHVVLEEAAAEEEVAPASADADSPDEPVAADAQDRGADGEVLAGPADARSPDQPTEAEPPATTWLLSGGTPGGLRGQAERILAFADDHSDLAPAAIGRALTARPALRHRLAVTATTRAELVDRLGRWLADPAAAATGEPTIATGPASGPVTAAFLFPGQGAQHPGMGVGLHAAFPVFADALEQTCAELDRHLDRPLWPLMSGPEDPESLLNQTAYAQCSLFALGVALAAQLAAWDIVPDRLIGHSIGELTAARVAGVLGLADACALVAARGALMQALPSGGAMASIQATEDEVRPTLAGRDDSVAIATINALTSTVVSGTEDAVTALMDEWSGRGRRVKRLAVSHAFHSPLMDGMLEDFRAVAASVTYRPPQIPLISNLTGRPVEADEICTPDYWVRHVRQPVRFADGVRALAEAGTAVVLELGPDSGLSALAAETFAGAGAGTPTDPVSVALLRRNLSEPEALLAGLSRAWRRGLPAAWPRILGTGRLDLPTYAFDRRRFWLDTAYRTPAATIPEDLQAPATTATSAPGAIEASDDTWLGSLAGLPAEERVDHALHLVRTHAARVLGHAGATDIDPDRGFLDAGFDSLTAVEFRNGLAALTGLALPATLIFDHPTPAAVASWIAAEGARDAAPAVRSFSAEPIAIIGMACRYPGGVTTPDGLWDLVSSGRDAISEFPADRGWPEDLYDPDPDRAGKTYCTQGGFLEDIAGFDAEFFGISPREALAMDPQQRLLLEVSWEALERAGLNQQELRGSQTGVYVGAATSGYADLGRVSGGADAGDGYTFTGNALSVLSGRVSYVFGLEGPAVSVDTACSSSMVALHTAVQALRRGECTLALAGGVQVMASPAAFVEFARQRGLASDGRCKAFAAGADGTTWAEGVGVLVVERLSDARRLGHPVLAVVRGSAVNQDGASSGLTAPNGPSQERVIRAALADAGLTPQDVDAIEAHGTGTALGDPIEAQALLNTYGRDREEPLYLGSIKSNLGHASAAAGVGGVIKMVQALRHRVLPPTLHVDEPTPMVDWSTGDIRLLTEAVAWDDRERPRRAGVSSFGVSGTNAHIVVEQAEPSEAPIEIAAADQTPDNNGSQAPVAWLVSGATEPGLHAQIERVREYAADRDPVTVARALLGRAQLRHRSVLVSRDREELSRSIGVAGSRLRPVWVFPGQGWQWTGMARELLGEQPVFAAAVAEVDALVREQTGWSPLAVLHGEASAEGVEHPDRVDVVQPTMFSVLVGLARLWESAGVRPAAVVGHSQGEIAAAHIAGILSLEDAVRVAVGRSRALVELSGAGAMAAVSASADDVASWLPDFPGVGVAAVNAPRSTVVSGPVAQVKALLDRCEQQGVRARAIDVDYASHGPAVEPVRERILRELADIRPRTGRIPLHSTLTGEILSGPEMDAAYWYENLRQPVRFAPVVAGMLDLRAFVEVSAHPVLVPAIEQIAEEAGAAPHVQPTLTRDAADTAGWLTALGRAWTAGATVNWPGVLGTPTGAHELPVYGFDRARYWAPGAGRTADAAGLGAEDLAHGLLGSAVTVAGQDGKTVLTGRLTPQGWLSDHAVASAVVLPGTAYVEMALRAGQLVGADAVEELVVVEPLMLPGPANVQVVVDADRRFTVYSRPADEVAAAFATHAVGRLRPDDAPAPESGGATAWATTWPPPSARQADLSDFYEGLAEAGYGYGPAFRGVRAAWLADDGSVFGEVELPEAVGGLDRFGVHPALLDSAAHLIAVGGLLPRDGLWLPFSWQDVRLFATGARHARVHVTPVGPSEVRIELADQGGAPLAVIGGLRARESRPGGAAPAGGLHQVEWEAVEGAGRPLGAVAVIGGLEVPGATAVSGWDEVPAGTSWVLLFVGEADQDPGSQSTVAAVHRVAQAGLRRLQELADLDDAAWGVTVVTAAGAESTAAVASAALHGMARTARNELPMPVTLLQTDDPASVDWPLALAHVRRRPDLAWRDGRLLAPHVAPARQDIRGVQGLSAAASDSWHLAPGGTGTFEDIAPVATAPVPLPPGHVRLRQRAAGLNFHDVVVGLAMVPGDDAFGGEGAGTVIEVAPDVSTLRVGDRVFGVMPDAFGPATVADARTVVPIPPGWTWEQAASVPAAFVTAYFALVDLAAVKPGERVLIHAATGGVGTAAVQLARHLGAEVYATASRAKWPVLLEMGIPPERIADSRTTEFAEQFAAEDITVTLGSLAGDHVDATLSLLSPGGRYLEMGKTDIRDPEAVARLHPGVSYRAFDAAESGPERTGEILAETVAMFEAGTVRHSPITAWPLPQAREALRHLSRGGHIGKNVLTIAPPLDPDGTILITGGTGTLGALAARHLAAPGRRFLLLSRQGPDAPGVDGLREDLVAVGAEVTVTACDTSDRDQLAAAIAGHKLTAVIHTAGVLRDATLPNQTPETLQEVLRAKVDAALHLHELTADQDLAAFVLYSSAAGVLGNPGQANYTAANTCLDALAEHRRALGLPATSIAWGLWSQASTLTAGRSQADQARAAASPILPLDTEQGLRLLVAATEAAGPYYIGAPRNPGHVPVDPMWGSTTTRRTAGADGPSVRAGQSADQILAAVRAHTAAVLGTGPQQIDPHRGFLDCGIDSLTAVELRNRLNRATGLRLTTTTIFDHPTPHTLARHIHEQLVPAAGGDEAAPVDVRELFAAIPLERLRGAGILEPLLRLAGLDAAAAEPGRTPDQAGDVAAAAGTADIEDLEDIDALDLDALVRLAEGGSDD